jgi:hypothetical protein
LETDHTRLTEIPSCEVPAAHPVEGQRRDALAQPEDDDGEGERLDFAPALAR